VNAAGATPGAERRLPEILAPAGGRRQLEAAAWAGADAVYFGLDAGLNARVRAESFATDELDGVMGYLHERGLRGYLALNTLVFDEELARAETLVRAAASAGVDALIVQDIGLARLARAVAPGLPLHGSTQMSITDVDGVALAADLGMRRVVVGRELAIDEIARLVEQVRARGLGVDIEVFVHGALCVSYSGQCFSSEAWGGRSANRGQCAQACRLPYTLLVDGEPRALGDRQYLLSPQDLMALEWLPQLVDAGVAACKIEGRLKGPDYVATTVTAYRDALDRCAPAIAGDARAAAFTLSPARRRELAQVFSRGQDAAHDGLTPGFLPGPSHQSVVIGRNPRHRGVLIGEVAGSGRRGIRVRLASPVKRGDGLVFDRGRPQASEPGGRVHHVFDVAGHSLTGDIDEGEVELFLGPEFAHEAVRAGDLAWRTRDPARDAGPDLDPRLARRRVAVSITVEGRAGQPLRLYLRDTDGHGVRVSSADRLCAATARPLDEAAVHKAIGILGDTPFTPIDCHIDLDDGLFLPVARIKALRREAIELLLAARRRHDRDVGLASAPQLPRLLARPPGEHAPQRAAIAVLCRTRQQVDAALHNSDIDEIIVDFLEVHGLKPACEAVKAAGRRLVVATPRIFKPGEGRLWDYLRRLPADALLVRAAGRLHGLRAAAVDSGLPPLHGDFSLNAANVVSARYLFALGLARLTPTHDLNARQVAALAGGLPAAQRDRLEVVIHQHLPVFHTEYCVFARFLSEGNSYRDCGRPCERHVVHLRDAAGGDHLVQADIGCRNTVFNAAAQSAAAVLGDLRKAGISRFRIELVDEPASQIATIVSAYRSLLDGNADSVAALRELARITDVNGRAQGVALGSLAVTVEPARGSMKKPTAR
jgi:collagenase-like PrtC family protease